MATVSYLNSQGSALLPLFTGLPMFIWTWADQNSCFSTGTGLDFNDRFIKMGVKRPHNWFEQPVAADKIFILSRFHFISSQTNGERTKGHFESACNANAADVRRTVWPNWPCNAPTWMQCKERRGIKRMREKKGIYLHHECARCYTRYYLFVWVGMWHSITAQEKLENAWFWVVRCFSALVPSLCWEVLQNLRDYLPRIFNISIVLPFCNCLEPVFFFKQRKRNVCFDILAKLWSVQLPAQNNTGNLISLFQPFSFFLLLLEFSVVKKS